MASGHWVSCLRCDVPVLMLLPFEQTIRFCLEIGSGIMLQEAPVRREMLLSMGHQISFISASFANANIDRNSDLFVATHCRCSDPENISPIWCSFPAPCAPAVDQTCASWSNLLVGNGRCCRDILPDVWTWRSRQPTQEDFSAPGFFFACHMALSWLRIQVMFRRYMWGICDYSICSGKCHLRAWMSDCTLHWTRKLTWYGLLLL